MSFLSIVFACNVLSLAVANQGLGVFEDHSDVGEVKVAGKVDFSSTSHSYTVTGSGENMWFAKDAFHLVWKRVSDENISITSLVNFVGQGKNPHRKACLIVRQSLDADSAYAAIVRHGDGLTSLQYRDEKGSTTHEIQSVVSNPAKLCLEKRGDTIVAVVSDEDGNMVNTGGSVRLRLTAPYYIGIGVCSHEADLAESAVFSKVEFKQPESVFLNLQSTLETVNVASTDRRVVKVFKDHIEAPNWTPDGTNLIYNSGGNLFKMPVYGGVCEQVETDFANKCNNDHGISPDGKWIAISDQSQRDHQSTLYILQIDGGTPRKVIEGTPSYWHGWSPDGKTLAFCGQRDGQFGIFTVPVEGGKERRLTTAPKLDDGPDYSPDGKYIYFNSDRSGKMQIYRMSTEGEKIEPMTSDDNNNWFPHISPDGKSMVFLTYEPDVEGHPQNKNVMLRLMNLEDRKITILAKLFGGQGTINVPSWSPDSKRLAFVSYQLVP